VTAQPGSPLRAVIVGAGLMGGWHARYLRRVRAAGRVAAVVDPDLTAAQRLAVRHPGCRTAPSLEAALARGRFDVAHICSPPDAHEHLVAEALDGGAHVLVEKPIAPTAAACDRLLGLAETRALLLCPVFQFVCQRGVRKALAELPALGTVRQVDLVACTAGGDGLDGARRAALAHDIALHALSLIGRIFPEEGPGETWRVLHPTPGEFRATAAIAEATVSIVVSTRGRPTQNTGRISADGGTVHLDLFHGFSVVERGRPTRMRKVARPFILSAAVIGGAGVNLIGRAVRREPAYPGLSDFIEGFYRAARTGGSPPISGSESRRIAAAAEALGPPPAHQ